MNPRELVATSVTNTNETVSSLSSFMEIYSETANKIIAECGKMLRFAPGLQAKGSRTCSCEK